MQETSSMLTTVLATSTILILFLTTFIIGTLFFYQKKQINYLTTLSHIKDEHQKELLRTQLEIRDLTFENISREIHDNIGLTLTLAKLHLNTISELPPTSLDNAIRASVDLISKAILDLTDLSRSMKSDTVNEIGFVKSVEHQLQNLKHAGKFDIRLVIEGEPIFLDSKRELILYRIVQEAFNNILKHSAAKRIEVVISYLTDSLMMKIQDDGVGFELQDLTIAKKGSSMSGLNNIKKRIQLISGTCSFESQKTKGTSLTIKIPFYERR